MKYLGSKKINTSRLELRAQTMEEQKYLWQVLMKPEINKYFLTVPAKYGDRLKDWDIQEPLIIEKIKHAKDLSVFEWSIFLKDNGKCIGRIICQEGENPDNPAVRDIGWIVDTEYQGKGYATEAATAMLDYMFNECEIEAIETSAAIINKPSWSLMEKLGFERKDKTKFNNYTYVDEPVESYEYYLSRDMFLNK